MNPPTPTLTPAQTAARQFRAEVIGLSDASTEKLAQIIAAQYRPLLEQARNALNATERHWGAASDTGTLIALRAIAALTRALEESQ